MLESKFTPLLADRAWMLEIVVGIVFLVIASYLFKFFIKKVPRDQTDDSGHWKQKFEKIAYVPMKYIFWTVGIIYVLNGISLKFGLATGVIYLKSIRNAVIVVCLAWILMRWKKEFQKRFQLADEGMTLIAGRLISAAIIFLASLIILEIFDIDVMPLIAFGGVGAAAIGFAAKDVLANFFGGMMLHLTRPFVLGDYILLPDRKIEGQVEMIGWYFTAIRDKAKRPVYLPNVFFSTLCVINSSRMSHRHFLETIVLRFQDLERVEAIVQEIKQYLKGHAGVDVELPIIVSLDSFHDYGVNLKLDFYCLTTKLEEFSVLKQELLLGVYALVRRGGGEVTYPTSLSFQTQI